MSKFVNNSSTNKRLPFCKVCQDAGKPEQLYTNHYVRDNKDGRVLCPTLLSQECRRCFQKGHTIKYCKESESRPTPSRPTESRPSRPTESRPSTTQAQRPAVAAAKISTPQQRFQQARNSTTFAFLVMSDDEDDSDKKEKKPEKDQFPQLCAAPIKAEAKKPGQFSYSDVAAKTVIDYKIEQIKEQKQIAPIVSNKIKVQFGFTESTAAVKTPILKTVVDGIDLKTGSVFSWTNCESDNEADSEDEYEDNSAW